MLTSGQPRLGMRELTQAPALSFLAGMPWSAIVGARIQKLSQIPTASLSLCVLRTESA
jgi:hypothetical protein